MILTILGCGTSTGVPLISCQCAVCKSRNPKNTRTRASVWWQVDGRSFLVDTSTDLRQQALREKLLRIDAVLYTHPHADHTHGIDELRSYNYIQKQTLPIYGNAWTRDDLVAKFSYIFKPSYVEGGGIPQLEFRLLEPPYETLEILGVPITPLPLLHGSKECLGYRIGSVAYVTDCSYIGPTTLERMQGLDTLVLDCLRLEKHGTHLNFDQALEVISQVRPARTYLTHLGHDFDYTKWTRKLPKGISLAYDGLKITVRGSSNDRRRTEGNQKQGKPGRHGRGGRSRSHAGRT